MSDIIKIDHIEQAKEQIITQYKNSPNLNAYIASFAKQFNELEDVGLSLLLERDINSAIGEQLNVIGRIVGLNRNVGNITFNDTQYRFYLQIKILKNSTKCTIPELTRIYTLIFNTTCYIYDAPRQIFLYVGRRLTPEEVILIRFKDELGRYIFPKVLGIGLNIIQFDPNNNFAYVGHPTAKGYNVGKYAGAV